MKLSELLKTGNYVLDKMGDMEVCISIDSKINTQKFPEDKPDVFTTTALYSSEDGIVGVDDDGEETDEDLGYMFTIKNWPY